MIIPVFRTSLLALLRDRGALVMSFVLPVAFFTLFALIFGGRGSSTPKVSVAIADLDRSEVSGKLVAALKKEPGLKVQLAPAAEANSASPAAYEAATAEAAVRAGKVPAAIVIPQGFGAAPLAWGPPSGQQAAKITILADSSDPIAAQMVSGLLQKVAMTAMPESMAKAGVDQMEKWVGLTPDQKKRATEGISLMGTQQDDGSGAPGDAQAGLVAFEIRDVLGEKKKSPLVAYYAAGVGVMFLLFAASGAGGALLEEAENGTLDRVLASRVTMTSLLLGKLLYLTFAGSLQLVVMFVWAWLVFKLELLSHLGGFAIVTLCAAAAASAFGLMLASIARTRAQLSAISTIVILMMSAVGGSMVPKFIMPEFMQKAGLFTFNAWALEGYLKVFWREEPLMNLAPQVAVLLGAGVVFFAVARRLARRWEFS